jgi:hypothetical protein
LKPVLYIKDRDEKYHYVEVPLPKYELDWNSELFTLTLKTDWSDESYWSNKIIDLTFNIIPVYTVGDYLDGIQFIRENDQQLLGAIDFLKFDDTVLRSLKVDENSEFSGVASFYESVNLYNNLTVSGESSFNEYAEFKRGIEVISGLSVYGLAEFNNNILARGDSSLNHVFITSGLELNNSDLYLSNGNIYGENAFFGNNVSITDSLEVGGQVTLIEELVLHNQTSNEPDRVVVLDDLSGIKQGLADTYNKQEIDGFISDIENSISGINTELEETNERIDNVYTKPEIDNFISGYVSGLEVYQTEISGNIDNIISGINNTLTEFDDSISGIRVDITGINDNIGNMYTKMEIDGYISGFTSGLEFHLSDINQKLSAFDLRLDSISGLLDTISGLI